MCLAVPGRVEEVREEAGVRMGRLNFGGVIKDVCLECVPEIAVGDYAIVHVGFAIGRLDETVALRTLRALADLGIPDRGTAEPRTTADEADASA